MTHVVVALMLIAACDKKESARDVPPTPEPTKPSRGGGFTATLDGQPITITKMLVARLPDTAANIVPAP